MKVPKPSGALLPGRLDSGKTGPLNDEVTC